jgi:hypothetical protein
MSAMNPLHLPGLVSPVAWMPTADLAEDQWRKAFALSSSSPGKPLSPAPLSGRTARVPDWLLRDFFVRGSTYILGGRGKVLKSSLLLTLAAVVTRGDFWPWLPEERAERGSVIWLGGEDAADITHLRMLANNADESKFHLFGVEEFGRRIGEDVPKLDHLCYRLGDVRMIVIDPLKSFLSGVSEIAARHAIAPLQELAARHNLLVWLVVHVTKGRAKTRRPIDLIADSAAFANAARGVWMVVAHPKDETSVLINLAHNVGPLVRQGVEFSTEIVTINSLRARYGDRVAVGRFPIDEIAVPTRFEIVEDLNIEALVNIGDSSGGRFDERALQWCVAYLERHPDGVPIDDIIAAGRAQGLYERRLRNALRDVAYHVGGHRGEGSLWFLRRDDEPPRLPN